MGYRKPSRSFSRALYAGRARRIGTPSGSVCHTGDADASGDNIIEFDYERSIQRRRHSLARSGSHTQLGSNSRHTGRTEIPTHTDKGERSVRPPMELSGGVRSSAEPIGPAQLQLLMNRVFFVGSGAFTTMKRNRRSLSLYKQCTMSFGLSTSMSFVTSVFSSPISTTPVPSST